MKLLSSGALAALALMAAGAAGLSPALADETVEVSLTDKGASVGMVKGLGMAMGGDMASATMAVVAHPAKVHAGKITFNVKNDSKDTIHEMLVAPVADTAKPLPYVDKDERVDEEASGDKGEVSELDPGKSGSLTLELKPGTYILYCNVAGHYMSGMWALFTVME